MIDGLWAQWERRMYPSDFETAEAVFSPVDPPLLLGLPPLLALLLLLLVAAIAAGMYFVGRWHADTSGGTDAKRAPEEIHQAVLLASMAAMAASSDELKSKAQALRTAIVDYLGPVLDVAKGITGPLKTLDEALKGEIEEEKKPDAAKAATPTTETKAAQGCGCGKPQTCTCKGVVLRPVTINQVYLGGGPLVPPQSCGCGGYGAKGVCRCEPAKPEESAEKDKAETKPKTRPMTGPEQIDALSKAVRLFHDHWSRGPERIRELGEARRALNQRPAAAVLKPAVPNTEKEPVWKRR